MGEDKLYEYVRLIDGVFFLNSTSIQPPSKQASDKALRKLPLFEGLSTWPFSSFKGCGWHGCRAVNLQVAARASASPKKTNTQKRDAALWEE